MDNFDFPGLVREKVKEMEKQVSNSELSASLCGGVEPKGLSECWVNKERLQLLAMTRSLEEHPEGYDGPCECQTCASYGD